MLYSGVLVSHNVSVLLLLLLFFGEVGLAGMLMLAVARGIDECVS